MKPTSKTLSWAFVIILLAVGIFTGLGVILMHKQPLVLQGQAEATNPYQWETSRPYRHFLRSGGRLGTPGRYSCRH